MRHRRAGDLGLHHAGGGATNATNRAGEAGLGLGEGSGGDATASGAADTGTG